MVGAPVGVKRHQPVEKNGSGSTFRGVSRGGSKKTPWKAHISVGGEKYWLGSYATEQEAYTAFCVAARDAGMEGYQRRVRAISA